MKSWGIFCREKKNRENVAVLLFFVVDNFDFPRKIVEFFYGKKIRQNGAVLYLLIVDNFDFTRKIVEIFEIR